MGGGEDENVDVQIKKIKATSPSVRRSCNFFKLLRVL